MSITAKRVLLYDKIIITENQRKQLTHSIYAPIKKNVESTTTVGCGWSGKFGFSGWVKFVVNLAEYKNSILPGISCPLSGGEVGGPFDLYGNETEVEYVSKIKKKKYFCYSHQICVSVSGKSQKQKKT